ncbi:hypothetical protein [Streptomyces griseorubiginosus]|uniref:hypothetical protein n=1 Tax=Streptomyces griseorubiginosus TaxID=67304 RepID=UPI003668B1AA
MRQQQALLNYVTTTAARDRLGEGGLGDRVGEAVDAGEIDEAAAITVMMAFLATGMDTTILSLAAAVRLFAQHPDHPARAEQAALPDRHLSEPRGRTPRVGRHEPVPSG